MTEKKEEKMEVESGGKPKEEEPKEGQTGISNIISKIKDKFKK